jgi:3-oxoacyl-(acyl-carrier-protein) synthase
MRSGLLRQYRAGHEDRRGIKNNFGFGGTNGSLVFKRI